MKKYFYPYKFIYVLFIALSLMLQTVAEAAVGKCSGGASDGSACISDEDCPGGTCIGGEGGLPGTCGPWNCAPEEWTVTAIGHERRRDNYCSGNLCLSRLQRRCAEGWYGVPNAVGTSGCQMWPKIGDVVALTIPPETGGEVGIDECFLPKETTLSDNTGDFEYTQNCYYTE